MSIDETNLRQEYIIVEVRSNVNFDIMIRINIDNIQYLAYPVLIVDLYDHNSSQLNLIHSEATLLDGIQ